MPDDGPSPDAPDVSVVLICFNDEERLVEAIASAQRQTLAAIEIIVVDHGSTDGSLAVARAAAAEDSRIRVVALPDNEGKPGRTINAGMDAARAPWVTVFASDDLLMRRACERMLAAARKFEADIVIGGVRRLNMETGEGTRWAPAITGRSRVVKDIRQLPDLIRDTIGGGKLYNRAFMAEHGLRFAEDIYYQDQVFTIEYFAVARTVAVVSSFVLDWRIWPTGQRQSVTQRRFTVENLSDRFTANERIDDYLRQVGRLDMLAAKQRKFVAHDLKIHVKELGATPPEYRQLLARKSREYSQRFEPEAMVGITLPKRLMLNCLVADRLEDAERVSQHSFGQIACDWARMTRGGRTYVVPPWSTQASQTPDPAFDVTDYRLHEVPPRFRSVRGDVRLEARRQSYEFNVTVRSHGRIPDDATAELVLLQPESGERLVVPLGCVVSGVRSVYRARISRRRLDRGLGLTPLPSRLWFACNRNLVDEWWIRLLPAAMQDETVTSGTEPWFTSTVADEIVLERLPDDSVRDRVAGKLGRRPEVKDLNELFTLGQGRAYLERTSIKPDGDVVFFEAFEGRRINDGPLAVSRLLHERRPKVRQYWGCTPYSLIDVPDYATPVPRHTRRYMKALSSAKTWFDNGWLLFAPGPDRRLVQLWHGTPVSPVGRELAALIDPEQATDPKLSSVIDAAPNWTHLASSGPAFQNRLDAAFDISARLVDCGAPRVDPLLSPGAARRRQDLRESWGIADRTVVLFCPVLRSGEVSADYRAPDIRVLAGELGPEYYWLQREHDDEVVGGRMAWTPEDLRWFAALVSGHQDTSDYLLMADVLVSDYSRLIADQGRMGRPVIHFVTDEQFYEKVYPTTFSHLADAAAGPVVHDEQGLGEAIRSVKIDDRSRAWADEIAPLDQGRSAEMLLTELGLL